MSRSAATVYGLQLLDPTDPTNRYDTVVTEDTNRGGIFSSRPVARAFSKGGTYTLASGGCWLEEPPGTTSPNSRLPQRPSIPQQPILFLTGSYPFVDGNGNQMWVCETQSLLDDPAKKPEYPAGIVHAYAVSIRDRENGLPIPMSIVKATSPIASQPTASAALATGGFVISGCGGKVEPGTPVNHQFLTAAFPLTAAANPTGPALACQASASDYGASAPGIVDAYAINLLLDRPLLTRVSPQPVRVGQDLLLRGLHFPPGAMQVQFDNGISAPTTAQTSASNYWRFAVVTVPATLPPGNYNVGILQSGLPRPVSQPLSVTVTP